MRKLLTLLRDIYRQITEVYFVSIYVKIRTKNVKEVKRIYHCRFVKANGDWYAAKTPSRSSSQAAAQFVC